MAELRTARTLCNSSCVYALIGAAVREVAAGARIGVHEIALGRNDGRGMPEAMDRKSLSQEQLKQLRAEEARLTRYIGEMGIDKALFEAAAQIRHERVRYLSLDEIARFGIDRREFQESRWMVDEGPPGTTAVVKFVVEAKASGKGSEEGRSDKGSDKGSEPKQFRTTLIRLTCGRPGEFRVQYSRELAPPRTRRHRLAVTTSSDAFVLAPARDKPMLGYNDVMIDDRFARVPAAFFAEAGDAIEVRQVPKADAGKASPPTRLSTHGLPAAIGALTQQCRRS